MLFHSLTANGLPAPKQGFGPGAELGEAHRLLQIEIEAGLFSPSPGFLARSGTQENNPDVENPVNTLAQSPAICVQELVNYDQADFRLVQSLQAVSDVNSADDVKVGSPHSWSQPVQQAQVS